MAISEFLGPAAIGLVGAVVYSGPLFPLAATLLFRRASKARFKKNLRLLIGLSAVQALSFIPYAVASASSMGADALYYLMIPFALGAILFVGGLIHLVREYARYHSAIRWTR